jgi:hypothetical protein
MLYTSGKGVKGVGRRHESKPQAISIFHKQCNLFSGKWHWQTIRWSIIIIYTLCRGNTGAASITEGQINHLMFGTKTNTTTPTQKYIRAPERTFNVLCRFDRPSLNAH